MKRELCTAVISLALLIGSAGVAASNNKHKDKVKKRGKPHVTVVRAVPEIDATSGVPAIALVLGAALLGAERLRRHAKPAS